MAFIKPNRHNPILKTLKEGDVVLLALDSMSPGQPTHRQIVRLKNLEYQPKDNEFDFDWLTFEGEVLYTSIRVHPSNRNFILTNCLGIVEKLNDFLVEKYQKDYNLFRPDEHQLSDEELEYGQLRLENELNSLRG